MSSFCILIPTINRKDLLMEALTAYEYLYPSTEIFILDSGNQNIPFSDNYFLFNAKKKHGVAKAWNALIDIASVFDYDKFLILNDDIILKTGQHEIEKHLENIDNNQFYRAKPFYNWSAFLLTKSIYNKVGRFDTNFEKCFFEDNDYEYRMKLHSIRINYCDWLSPEVYKNSMSTQRDPLLGDYVANKQYYIEKWGGEPNNETFKTPYNNL